MEGIHTVRDLIQPNDWMMKIDLRDTYFAIPIAQSHQKYLRFTVQNRCYQFSCLPFGLSSAPWIFTKILRPVAEKLRELSIRMVIYLDDTLIMGKSPQETSAHTVTLTHTLENLGFTIHPEKSMTQPTQRVEFLGLIINSTSMELQAPSDKVKKIRAEARKLWQANAHPSAREVSRIVEKMSAVAQAILPAPLFFRYLQRDLTQALAYNFQDYEALCPLSSKAKDELQWWTDHLPFWNGKDLWTNPSPNMTIESDASLMGWGATSDGINTGGPWNTQERRWHINCLEIPAAYLAVRTFAKAQFNIQLY